MSVGSGQAAAHRRSDLATQGLLRPGATPGQNLEWTADSPTSQSGSLHLRAVTQQQTRPPPTQPRPDFGLSNCTATVLVLADHRDHLLLAKSMDPVPDLTLLIRQELLDHVVIRP